MYFLKAEFGITSRLQKSVVIIPAVLLPLKSIDSSPNSDFVSSLHIVLVLCLTEPILTNVKDTLT